MSSTPPTFATLRALHSLVGEAIDDIQRVFTQAQLIKTPSPPPSLYSSPAYPGTPEPVASFPTTPSASFPPTPLSSTFPDGTGPPTLTSSAGSPIVDYPSPDRPIVPTSLGEQLAAHPDAAAAAMRIVAACGQISNIVHKPFLSLCDGLMSYNLPACLRLLEHLHVVEILREAEDERQCLLAQSKKDFLQVPGETPVLDEEVPMVSTHLRDGPRSTLYEAIKSEFLRSAERGNKLTSRMNQEPGNLEEARQEAPHEGMHVTDLARVICVHTKKKLIEPFKLAHVLRLLSAHHLLRETAPDRFALTRVISLLDTGKSVKEVFSSPATKYEDTNGIAAFVGMTTDELFKSAAYLTEAFTGVQLPNPTPGPFQPRNPTDQVASECSAASTLYQDCVDCSFFQTSSNRSPSVLTETVEADEVERPAFSNVTQPLESIAPRRRTSECLVRDTNRDKIFPTSSLPPPTKEIQGISSSSHTQDDHQIKRPDASEEHDNSPAFNLAFHTEVPYFEWLESGGKDPLDGTGMSAGDTSSGSRSGDTIMEMPGVTGYESSKPFRLERFSKAMIGTSGWEAPGAILSGFDWQSLPNGSTIVDVGGGIGSTTMVLARAFDGSASIRKRDDTENEGLRLPQATTTRHRRTHVTQPSYGSMSNSDESQDEWAVRGPLNIRFIVQDRPVVVGLGLGTWRSQCPDMLESGRVVFQEHDFFQPQPPLSPPHLNHYPAVYLLRVVLHDWPDDYARRILVNLRRASGPDTKLLIADHVVPLGCVDECVQRGHRDTRSCQKADKQEWTLDSVLTHLEGAERVLAMPPLLPNMGKANANVYWMDLLMHITFNGKERTLRELCALALSAGWRVARMTRSEGSMFGYLVCVPILLPEDVQEDGSVMEATASTTPGPPGAAAAPVPKLNVKVPHQVPTVMPLLPSPVLERSSSRCGTPTFGSRMSLPCDDEINTVKGKGAGAARKWLKARGLGVRSVASHKVERMKLKDEACHKASTKVSPIEEALNDDPRTSPRVWWKKPLAGSTTPSVTELDQLPPEQYISGRPRRGTITQNDGPSTPAQNSRVATPSSTRWPTHHAWPSTELAISPNSNEIAERSRRPSVASITRKLSFATFARRPSIPDLDEPLPPPPPSAPRSDLAPSASLQGKEHQDARRRLKHLQSSPVLRRGHESATPTIYWRPSPADTAVSTHGASSPASGSSARSPDSAIRSASQHHFPRSSVSGSSQSASPPTPHRQRSVTLVASSSASSRIGIGTGGVPPEPIPASPKVKRTSKLPRRLSIPLLRRKQSNAVPPDQVEGGGDAEARGH